ncbi:MAG: pyridoxamine 5'-phosphate oxidase family protein [Prevotellaceae bacterium]|jgi:uncharacterized protein YhbP (UPF0306 family)|nr:pyridoxamine 5'-phosphate oxidase family protein [Prevotellaceae bacterium]
MYSIDTRIVDFIQAHHVLTLATCTEGKPYCTLLFYIYLADENVLVFASEKRTRHIDEAMANPAVAGSVALETNVVGLIRGLQWQGQLFSPPAALKRKAKRAYWRRFPFVMLKGARLWTVRPTFFKYTDNRLGFGKKIIVTLSSNEK